MRTKKRVFRSFGYLECDAFAEYLKEMAASGWHFSGIYYICYGQKILRLSVEEPLTKEQIQVVEERLKLKE